MKKKKFLTMVLATTLALGTMVFTGCKKDEKDVARTPTSESVQSANDMTMTAQGGSGIQMLSVLIEPSEYTNYGVSANAESAHLVTASYPDGEYVSNPAVEWFVEFVDSQSAWAKGKSVTDYVTVTPTSDGALTAVVECKQAFGEQICVVCRSQQSPDLSASFVCDYMSKIAKMEITFAAYDGIWNFADVNPLDSYYTTIAGELLGTLNQENYINLNQVDMVGKYQLDLSALSLSTGTTLDWTEKGSYSTWSDLLNVDEYLSMLESSNVLTKRTGQFTDLKGRCMGTGEFGLPGIEWLSEANRQSILYYWTLNHGGDVSDSRLEKYDDGGVAYVEYLRIMNELAVLSGDTVTYTYAIDIGHTYFRVFL